MTPLARSNLLQEKTTFTQFFSISGQSVSEGERTLLGIGKLLVQFPMATQPDLTNFMSLVSFYNS